MQRFRDFASSASKQDAACSDPVVAFRWGGIPGQQGLMCAQLRRERLWLKAVPGTLETGLSDPHHAFAFGTYSRWYLANARYWFNHRFRLADMPERCNRPPTPS